MYTHCPDCHSIFQVSADQLSLAGGKVRCGECRHVYVATEHLFDDIAAAREAVAEIVEPEVAEEAVQPVDYVKTPEIEVVSCEVSPQMPPLLGGWEQRPFSLRDAFSAVAALLLLLSLGGQWMWFSRDDLAASPGWRPLVEQLCSVLHCTLPLQADTNQLAIVSRDVRQHPRARDALLINAAFENRAGFVQPYPVLEISFTDNSGDPVAGRRFTPSEYLGDESMIAQGLPSDTPVHLVLEVMDPGDEAVSYQFGFL